MTLNELKINKIAIVEQINLDSIIKRRILDLGLVQGTKVKPVLQSIAGNPKAYEIRGSLIAIRNEDANKIIVK